MNVQTAQSGPYYGQQWTLRCSGSPVLAHGSIDGQASVPQIMAILNCTPDSFSDGGQHFRHDAARDAARQAVEDGATWLDIGGESSRPGAQPVSEAEEQRRVLPVIESIVQEQINAVISVDTCKASVAELALQAGAHVINDIRAGADPDMFSVVADANAGMVLMHMQGTPKNMQDQPQYTDVVDEVIAFLQNRMDAACAAGVPESAIILDPGIGFGKTVEHNLALMRGLERLLISCGRPLLLGVSRKSFIPALLSQAVSVNFGAERDMPSHVVHALLAPHSTIMRVHDVPGTRDALTIWQALGGHTHA